MRRPRITATMLLAVLVALAIVQLARGGDLHLGYGRPSHHGAHWHKDISR